jgi:hypothetical protein
MATWHVPAIKDENGAGAGKRKEGHLVMQKAIIDLLRGLDAILWPVTSRTFFFLITLSVFEHFFFL